MGACPPSTQDGRDRFASALQSALTMDEVQRAFLEAAGEVIPARGFGLYKLDEQQRMIDFKARVDVDFLDDYEDYGRADDPVLDFVLREHRPIDSSRATSQSQWESSGARDAIGMGGYRHSMEAPVIVSGMLYGTINFARTDAEPGFASADLVSARAVSEQLGLATERALRYERTGRRASTLEDVLDRLPQAVVVTDLDAQVLFSNRAARSRLGESAGGVVQDSITEATALFRSDSKRVYSRTRWDQHSQRTMIVKCFRLPDYDDAAMTLVFSCARDENAQLPVWNALSKREQEIAQLVSEGLTNKQIAARAFVSENTVKQHLKRVFSKTDVRNRAELMQRIWAAGGRGAESSDRAFDED